jgi:Zn-dependent M16 (insulinase) family peptidase
MITRRLYVSLGLFLCVVTLLTQLTPVLAQNGRAAKAPNVTLESLMPGKVVSGFRTVAVYADESEKLLGARFVHTRTNFTLDLLRIQSVPQGHIWVNSFPTSDMGEPHTQEHLLLGKGSVGRAVSSAETMSLVASNAFTQQLRTSYFFNTAAGPEVFYDHFERQMNALLRPNYSDEEIRREVRNFGVAQNPADKTLRLEEKGSVYNEMTSSFSRSGSRLFHQAALTVYGPNHPLSYVSGGTPEGIRIMKPEDIKRFHEANYHLGNMGMVASVPKEMAIGDVLSRTAAILDRLEPQPPKTKFKTQADLPPAKMAQPGTITIVDYPDRNEQQPGLLFFVWPATLQVADPERALIELFLDNIAGDPTTNLYKKFVDTKTRTSDVGAKGVFNFVSSEIGYPIYIGLTDVPPANMTEQKITEVRQQVLDEIALIASFKDGSPELTEFNERLKNRVIETRRQLSKFVNSPPGFGFRNTGSGWMDQLDRINKAPGFKKSVTMKNEMAFIDKLISSNQNVWRDYVGKWGLTGVKPYALAAKPNPQLLKQEETERLQRVTAEMARLKAKYSLTDEQETIQRYQAEYDAASAEIDETAKKDPRIGFINTPPMTLDDQLDFKLTTTAKGVPLVTSTFDNMTSATTGMAMKLGSVPEEELVYLSMFPALLTRVGVIKDGKAITYEEVSELWKKEILSLNSSFSVNNRTERVELVVRGSGNDLAESKRAVEWMNLVLFHPNWRPENLARIRDVVDQTLSGLRNTMQGAEESWVNDPSTAYRKQDNPLILTTSSFLTRMHNVQRLRWLLKDAGPDSSAISQFLEKIAGAGQNAKREELTALLATFQGKGLTVAESLKPLVNDFGALSAGAKALVVEAAKDLAQTLNEIPDASLAADWNYVANEIRRDLLVSPEKTLADLDRVRQRITKTGNTRAFVIGSQDSQKQLEPPIQTLLAGFETKEFTPTTYSKSRLIDERLQQRIKEADQPIFVGLLNPNTQSGVIMNSAPLITYEDTSRESLLRYLASKLYSGGGSHGIFTKTIGAGLAYSNGLGGSPTSGRGLYYAERTPEVPQTLKFVIDELKKAPRDSGLSEYAIAQTFLEFRAASTYESRGESMAADIADGVKPELVKQFRQAVLDLRKTPNLSDQLFNRMGAVYARVLPGYDPNLKTVPGGVYFIIGSEKQFVAYEAYLKSTLGADVNLWRLYPRDFWMVPR